MCSNPALSDKEEYPTFARTFSDWTPALIKVVKTFNWNTVILIHSRSIKFESTAEHLKHEFEKPENNIKISCELSLEAKINYNVTWGDMHYRPFMEKLNKMPGGGKY